jgi:hypothetical protein
MADPADANENGRMPVMHALHVTGVGFAFNSRPYTVALVVAESSLEQCRKSFAMLVRNPRMEGRLEKPAGRLPLMSALMELESRAYDGH